MSLRLRVLLTLLPLLALIAVLGGAGVVLLYRLGRRANDIRRMNQENMEQASAEAKRTAASSVAWFAVGLAAAVLVAGLLAWHTARTLVGPIQALTRAAHGIAAGNLDQLVPYLTGDELGEL